MATDELVKTSVNAFFNTQEPPTRQRYTRFGRRTDEEQREDDDELIDAVSEDVLGHGAGDERLVAAVRLPLQQGLGGRFRRQGQGRKGVHDQVHPQHLHRLQRRVLMEGDKVEEGSKINQIPPEVTTALFSFTNVTHYQDALTFDYNFYNGKRLIYF